MNYKTKNISKILCIIIALIFILQLVNCYSTVSHKQNHVNSNTSGKSIVNEFKLKAMQAARQGYDISEAERLEKKAKVALHNGNKQKAINFYKNALSVLNQITNIAIKLDKNIKLKIKSNKARLIETFPKDSKIHRTNIIDRFHVHDLFAEQGQLNFKIDQPCLIEEYPYTSFQKVTNTDFGSTESGLVYRRFNHLTNHDFKSKQNKIFQMLSSAGVGIARGFKSFDTLRCEVEKTYGQFDFSRALFAVNKARDNNIKYIGRLSLHRSIKQKGPLRDERTYQEYVKNTVQRFKGIVDYWQILKEPEPGVRKHFIANAGGILPDDCVNILKLTYQTVNSVDPEAKVFFPGMGPPFLSKGYDPESYFERIMELGGGAYFDVLGVNAYVSDIEKRVKKYKELMNKYGLAKPIWIAQTGVPDQEFSLPIRFQGGASSKKQSAFMVKTFAKAFSLGVEKVFWGEFLDSTKVDRGLSSEMSEIWERTGLLNINNWNKKPSYYTYRLLSSALLNFHQVERIAPNIVKFEFIERSPIYIVWPKKVTSS